MQYYFCKAKSNLQGLSVLEKKIFSAEFSKTGRTIKIFKHLGFLKNIIAVHYMLDIFLIFLNVCTIIQRSERSNDYHWDHIY